jgi:transposase
LALEWARTPAEKRPRLEVVASQLGRSAGSVKQFLRRTLPKGSLPWVEKGRWLPEEIESVKNGQKIETSRSPAAIRKWKERHGYCSSRPKPEDDPERIALTPTQVATDIGTSRATVYRLLKKGILRRFKGGIAETTFKDLLREHPEAVPYSKLSREQKEWLVLNGYPDPLLNVKAPTTRGILDVD